MHHCLFVQEIVRNICEQAAPEVLDGEVVGSDVLHRMALTCKIFRDSALDVIWRDLPGLEPLLLCMSPDLWSRDADDSELVCSRFSFTISPVLIHLDPKPFHLPRRLDWFQSPRFTCPYTESGTKRGL